MRSFEAGDRDRRSDTTDRAPGGDRGEPTPERRRRPRPTERYDRAEPTAKDRGAGEREAGERDRPERAESTRGRRLTAEMAARLAADYVAEMTGKEPEGITSLERSDDGTWQIDVEVVETHRIPDTADILAVYQAELDLEGELVAYRRIERYSRCQVGRR